jgi:hypothetical protein
MGRSFVCALSISLLSTGAWASATTDDLTPAELLPEQTSFAYRVRHSSESLPGAAFNALWFSGPDRDLPRETVAEPIVVLPAENLRPTLFSRTALCSHAALMAAEHDLPAPFFANLIQQESGFKSHVVSPAGAQGIAQFMPKVARAYGLHNPFDPLHSLAVSARFLRELLQQFGNLGLAAAAYNAGPRRVQDWMAKRGRLPEETRNYVRNITGQPAERWARVKAPTEEKRLPAHARCPGIPTMEVSVPEAAPVKLVKIAKKGGKGWKTIRVADASDELPKVAIAREEGPKLAAAKSFKLAAAAPGKQVAVIKNGKIRIMAEEKGKKAAATVAVREPKAPAKVAAKTAKPESKVAAKPAKPEIKVAAAPAKPGKAATKVAVKEAAKPAGKSKQAVGKGTKLAAAR